MLCVPATAVTYPTESQPRVGEGFMVVTPPPPTNPITKQPYNLRTVGVFRRHSGRVHVKVIDENKYRYRITTIKK